MGNTDSSTSSTNDDETRRTEEPESLFFPPASPSQASNQCKHKPVDPLIEARSFILGQAMDAGRIATLKWDDFLKYMSGLNERCRNLVDANGKYVIFAIKKGTHDSYFWKATVRICCVKMNYNTSKVESRKVLTLPQFLRLHSSLVSLLSPDSPTLRFSASSVLSDDNNSSQPAHLSPDDTQPSLPDLTSKETVGEEGNPSATSLACSSQTDHEVSVPDPRENILKRSDDPLLDTMGVSMFMTKLETVTRKGDDLSSECVICMERRPDVILPCSHCYCLPCIEQWNVNHQCCPICRSKLKSTEDAWVISEAPEEEELAEYLLSVTVPQNV